MWSFQPTRYRWKRALILGGGEDEEEEVEEEKDDTVGRDPSGVSPAAGSESTEEVRQKTSVEKKEEPAGEET